MQRGHASGSGGRDARQSDLWNAVLGAVRSVKQSAYWRYFFWLMMMTFNLFGVGGYFLFSGIGNIGDWAEVVAGWQPAWARGFESYLRSHPLSRLFRLVP